MDDVAETYKKLHFSGGVVGATFGGSALDRAMLDATLDCIKLISPDGTLLHMNRAGCDALGVDADGGFGMPWLPLLPASVHEAGYQALLLAGQGSHARFPGLSESEDGLRNWDNLLTPLHDSDGVVQAILCVSRDMTEKTRLEHDLADAVGAERLIVQEMRHRIKNVFTLVSGLIRLSEREAQRSSEPRCALEVLQGKVDALARAADATFTARPVSEAHEPAADVEAIVTSVLEPYGARCRASGEKAGLKAQSTTALTLLLYELSSNSVKHGAFSASEGEVAVSWQSSGDMLHINWSESGGPEIPGAPAQPGFGSMMMERYARTIGGTIELFWLPEGLSVRLSLPA